MSALSLRALRPSAAHHLRRRLPQLPECGPRWRLKVATSGVSPGRRESWLQVSDGQLSLTGHLRPIVSPS